MKPLSRHLPPKIAMRYIISIILICCLQIPCKGTIPILPLPQKITYTHQQFILNDVTLEPFGQFKEWDEWVQTINDTTSTKIPPQRTIRINQIKDIPEIPINKEEAYKLQITETQINVISISRTGIYRALQTLKQLITSNEKNNYLPTCEITDWPAFRIRGFMHDVGRTYISLKELKKEIELLSRFKINVFHWHLTENQAWRLESKLYPELNSPQNMTRMPGKYYTLQEAKELVKFCKEHHVMLIPEIDMPGHSEAFNRAFHADMQSQKGMEILKKLMDEVCETFDVPYIHIGTDEVKFTNPEFVPEMVRYVRSKGKKVISWNPGWNYQPGEIDMTQLWSYRGKAQPGIPAIDCRFHYLNHFDTYADLVALYNSRIYNCSQGSEDIAGSILAIWNDRYITDEKQIVAENNLYANMLALAERAWLGGGTCYFDGPETLLRTETPETNQKIADFEQRMLWHKHHTFAGEPFPYVRQSHVKWNITDAFPNQGDLRKKFPPEDTEAETYEYEGKRYQTHTVNGAGIYLRHVWGNLVPGFYKNPQENHTAYATTWVYSPEQQSAGLLLEFQNYSRSESDLPPEPGKWDYKESRAWLNGHELLPPQWQSTHKERSNEIPLTNENCVSRPPLQVQLHKGWNKLMLKLPIGKFQTPQVRLVKWMFAAVFVTPDGTESLENLIYSPTNPEKQ